MTIYKPARLFASASQRSFAPTIANTPPLPVIDWSQIGQVAPTLLGNPSSGLPSADAIVLTWADRPPVKSSGDVLREVRGAVHRPSLWPCPKPSCRQA
jgi:hypothetical protein